MKHRVLFTVEVLLEIEESVLLRKLGTADMAEADLVNAYDELTLSDFGELSVIPNVNYGQVECEQIEWQTVHVEKGTEH